ncbi:MAG: hypothetical protein ACLT0X_05795, partial [Collinsella sp.]
AECSPSKFIDGLFQTVMGTWLLRALVPAAASALRACRLGDCGGAAGSCGALRLLPEVTLGLVRIEGEWFPGK